MIDEFAHLLEEIAVTFQPPPPGNTPPPPPPPGYGQGPSGGFDPKTVNQLDWGILGVGVLAFVFSLFDYYTVSVNQDGFSSSASENAWHGFFGWFATLLAIVGSAAVAAGLFSPQTKLPIANRVAGLLAYVVALVSAILALFIFPESVPDGIDTGRGFGYWASLVVIIVGVVLSLMRAQQTNTALPGPLANMPKIGR